MCPCLRHYHAISIIPLSPSVNQFFFCVSFPFLPFFFLSFSPSDWKEKVLEENITRLCTVSTVLSSASPYSRHGLLTESGSRHCFNHRESRAQQCSIVLYPASFIQLFLPLRRSFFFPRFRRCFFFFFFFFTAGGLTLVDKRDSRFSFRLDNFLSL